MFVKLDCKTPFKSIWRENSDTRIVWITILMMADATGLVESSILGISDFAKVGLPETEIAINKFLSPDPYSTNPDNDGRRISRVIGGFQILNYSIYREKDHTNALRQKRYREEHNGSNELRNTSSASVYVSKKSIPPNIEDVKEYIKLKSYSVDADTWYDFYQSKNWMIGKNKMVDWQAAIRTWTRGNYKKQKPFGGYTESSIHRQESTVDPVTVFLDKFPEALLPIKQYFGTQEFDGKLLEIFKDNEELESKLNWFKKQHPKADENIYRKNYLYGKYGIPEVENEENK